MALLSVSLILLQLFETDADPFGHEIFSGVLSCTADTIMRLTATLLISLPLIATSCSHPPDRRADPGLLAEIQAIRAIDNHAHPVRVTAPGYPPDRGFDALPVDHLEASSDPLMLRPGAPAVAEAQRALFGSASKQSAIAQRREQYPAWVLDRLGIDIMFANRVEMGPGIAPPRFRWVGYADALLFPLDNAALAARNSDRAAFFALEDQLRKRYWTENGVIAVPATLTEYLATIVTPTLERHRHGGAAAEKFEAAYLRSLTFQPVDAGTAGATYAHLRGRAAPGEAEYKRSRISCSATSPRNAAAWAWPSTFIPRPAQAAISMWPGRIRSCSNRCSMMPACAKRGL